jgi:hypothetical protein
MNNEDFTILDGPATLTHDSLKKDDNPQRKDLKDIFGDPGAVDSLKYYVRMPVSGFSDSDFSSRLHQVFIF